ncbi:MAG: efflux RND transporter periplasmic adaptor subunit [Saprospiraceae bacterium]|nr:efflux RND transporter periplasmic adaptor subunit [Saprospiraceae bacterium]
MLKFNILYWILLPLILLLIWFMNRNVSNQKYEFLGFAENKQSEINVDFDIEITKIHVNVGNKVKKGQLLAEVDKKQIDEELKAIESIKQGLVLKNNISKAEIQTEISKLENRMNEEVTLLRSKLNSITSDAEFYKQLAGKTGIVDTDLSEKNPTSVYKENLETEIKTITNSYSNQISAYKKLLVLPSSIISEIDNLNTQKAFLKSQQQKFRITAPFDGIVGNINVREGENVKAFTSLITFYELTPPFVTGYLNEKYTANFENNSKVRITSLYHPEKTTTGTIISKGLRIVEIPEKFRKFPEVKTYGIEVFIKIDPDNIFLQKEVLKIQTIN